MDLDSSFSDHNSFGLTGWVEQFETVKSRCLFITHSDVILYPTVACFPSSSPTSIFSVMLSPNKGTVLELQWSNMHGNWLLSEHDLLVSQMLPNGTASSWDLPGFSLLLLSRQDRRKISASLPSLFWSGQQSSKVKDR